MIMLFFYFFIFNGFFNLLFNFATGCPWAAHYLFVPQMVTLAGCTVLSKHLFFMVFLLWSTLLGVLMVGHHLEHPTLHSTTLVIIVVVVAPTGSGSKSPLVFSLAVWVWQHPACPTHISNNCKAQGS